MRTNFFHTSSTIPNLIEEGNLRRMKRRVKKIQSKERKSEEEMHTNEAVLSVCFALFCSI